MEEARKQAEVKHPHVVTVLEARDNFIVYEYYAGGTLREKFERQGRFAPREAAELIAKLADALQAAHQKDLYHLDVKPANILLDEEGNPFLADFGLAVTDGEAAVMDAARGTPMYMSPEQTRGEVDRIHGASDIYCLGAVLYQLLTGREPFRRNSFSQLLRRARVPRRPRPLRQIDPLIPKRLETICLWCMSPRIDTRYRSAKDLADDLRGWLTNDQTKPAVQLPVQSRRFGDRALVLCSVVTLAFVVIATASVLRLVVDRNTATEGANVGGGDGQAAEPDYVEALLPDPEAFSVTRDDLAKRPAFASKDVHFVMRNLTRHAVEIAMFNCSLSSADEDDLGLFERETQGRVSQTILQTNQSRVRPLMTGNGWYIFFVRRVDGHVWYPYRASGSDVGKRNVCGSRYVVLEISEGSEEGVPYVWSFHQSDEPFADVNAPPSDEA